MSIIQLALEVGDDELLRRKNAWSPPQPAKDERGYRKLFMEHVNQAGEGVDFDFLTSRPFTEKTP